MRIRTDRIWYKLFALLVLLVLHAGCAETNVRIKSDTRDTSKETAQIQSVEVTGEQGRVEITADKPLAYTYYKSTDPLMAVIDLAQAQPGNIAPQREVNSGNIKTIAVSRHEIGGTYFSRIEISMVSDESFTVTPDPENKGKLLLTFLKGQPDSKKEKSQESGDSGMKAAQSDKPAGAAEPAAVVEKAVLKAEDVKENVPAAQEAAKPVQPQEAGAGTVEARAERKIETKADVPAPEPGKPAHRVLSAVTVVKDGVELEVSGGADRFNSFTLTGPKRLVVDIFAVKNGIAAKAVPVNGFGIGKARLGQSPDKVRIVFDVQGSAIPAYQVVKTDKGVKVVFSDSPPAAAAREMKTDPVPAPVAAAVKDASPGPGSVDAIDFKIENGSSRVSIKVSGDCTAGKPLKSAHGFSLTVQNCQIPRHLQRTIDTSAFRGVVTSVTPYQVKIKKRSDARILVKLRAASTYTLSREGDTIVWDFKNPPMPEEKPRKAEVVRPQPPPPPQPLLPPATTEMARTSGKTDVGEKTLGEADKRTIISSRMATKKVYTGKRVSLEFSDADIRKIFQLIAEVSNFNFIIADDVTGTISLKLVNVPWDQALDIILESKNLEQKREGNIVYIKPKGSFKTQEQEDADAQRVRERTMELKTQVFEVNFASLTDVASQFKLMASDRGKDNIIQDVRTNQIIVKDIEPKLQEMFELLKKLDVPEKQVMIEARIVEATSTFTRDLGVQWGIHYSDGSSSFLGINQLDTGFGGVVSAVPPAVGFQDPGTSGGSMGVSFGKLTSNLQVDMRLSAAASAGLIKIVSTPKVLTLNNKAAKITQGQMQPYSTVSAEGTKTQFIEAALTLEVTPHITPDGNIGMKIHATNNSIGAAPLGATPPINIKEATTELVVKNGETTVIGGIYQDNDTETDSGVPYLMDIPMLGWLFKSNSKQKTKTELLIFITPKVAS